MENNMKDFFDTIIQMNIYASIAIICVILLRYIFKSMPKRFICLLWIVVAVRLVCPYSGESNFSLLNFKSISSFVDKCTGSNSKVEKTTDNETTASSGSISLNRSNTDSENANSGKNSSPIMMKKSSSGFGFSLKKINYTIVWLVGMMMLLLLYVVNYIRISIRLKKIDKTVCDGYFESEYINTPFAAGIINPDIYIPKGIEDVEKRYILLHEKVHIKNKDCLIKTFGMVLRSVNWFNPLIWLAYKLMCDDLEMRCDEEVIKSMDTDVVQEYCISIVMHSIDSKVSYKIPGVCFAKKSFGGMEVKMRIKNMFSKKISKSVAVVALAASVLTATALSTQAKTDDKKGSANETVVNTQNSEEVETSVDTENTSSEVLEKYVKEYQDNGYVLSEDYNEGDTEIFLFDSLTNNNESINIRISDEQFDSLDAFKAGFDEIEGTVLKSEFSETDDCYVMTEKDDKLGYCMEYKYYKNDNVIVIYSTGLQNGVG
ncbi:MAG TPA: hypothetical protein DCL29_03635 [Eubacterium sp.]|nr:hypothetical protein [Eubacterium sp.]